MFRLHLAPMENITDVAFRSLIAKTTKRKVVTYSEMLPAKRIIINIENFKDWQITRSHYEKRYGVQIFGSTIDELIKSAKIIEKHINVDFINFNFGCPSRKILKINAGGSWLKRINEMFKLSEALKKELSVPISFKTRLGFDNVVVEKFKEFNIDEIIIHARTIKQQYSGVPHYEPLYKLKNEVNYRVIGNGNIFSKNDFFARLKNLDGLMIGRGALLNPGIFSEILFDKKQDKLKLWFNYYEFALQWKLPFSRLKLNSMWFLKGLKNIKKAKESLMKTKNHDELFDLFSKINAT